MFNFDSEFIKKLIQKDKNTFNEFYLKTINIFFRYLKSNYFIEDKDCEDLISDFYYKLWLNLDNYNPKYNFNSWIWIIFKNMVKDFFKKSKEISFSSIGGFEEDSQAFEDNLVSNENVFELMTKEFEFKQIKDAIEKLDDLSKDILFLKFIEEQSNEEISKLLSISNDNVRQKISRSLKKLKDILDFK